MAKLWDKGYSLDRLVERFTVGRDFALDERLVAADAVASIAHARMLERIGLVSAADRALLERELRAIARQASREGFPVRPEQEDSHTAIEERLVERLGETGKRIHTGRSRNDQVLASTRLFAREGLLAVRGELVRTVSVFAALAARHRDVPMVGRTHLQPAMPSTVGLWAASYAELLLDADTAMAAAFALVDRSPLGAAAGFGVPLPLDREFVAAELGFAGVHHNVLATMTSRGIVESVLLGSLETVGIVLSRLASDVMLFSLPEFGYFKLPKELCSGSSIMPQKRNPDAVELLRARAGVLSSYADRVAHVVRGLHSSYNRDVQETKEPLVRGLDLANEMLAVAALVASRLEVDRERLRAAFTAEVYATDRAIEYVSGGMSFRDAYRRVAAELDGPDAGSFDPDRAIAARTSTGTPGNPDLGWIEKRAAALSRELDGIAGRVGSCVAALAGEAMSLYPGLAGTGDG